MPASKTYLTLTPEDQAVLANGGLSGTPSNGSVGDAQVSAISIGKVTGLQAALNAKLAVTDLAVTPGAILYCATEGALQEIVIPDGQYLSAASGMPVAVTAPTGTQGAKGDTGAQGANGNTPRPFPFFIPGTVANNASTVPWPVYRPQVAQFVTATVTSAPTADITVDVLAAGSSIFPSGHKLVIPAGQLTGSQRVDPSLNTIAAGSTLQVAVVGNANGVTNLLTQVWCIEGLVTGFLDIKQNDCDFGLANATALTAGSGGNTGYTGNDYFDVVVAGGTSTVKADTSVFKTGASAVKFTCAAGANDAYVGYTFTAAKEVWAGGWFQFATAFGSNATPRVFAFKSGSTQLGSVFIGTTGKVVIQTGSASSPSTFQNKATGTTTIGLNAWYRFSARVVFAGNNSFVEVRIYDSTNTLLETLRYANSGDSSGSFGTSCDTVLFGRSGSPSSALANTYYADGVYASGTGYRGF